MKRNYLLFLLFFCISILAYGQGSVTVIHGPEAQTEGGVDTNIGLRPYGISSDGKQITGTVARGSNSFVWNKTDGLKIIDPDYLYGSTGFNISNNGLIIGEAGMSSHSYIDPFTGETLYLQSGAFWANDKWNILELPSYITWTAGMEDPSVGNFAGDVTPDGKIIVGAIITNGNPGSDMRTPVKWTIDGDNISLIKLESEERGQGARAMCTSDDGRVIGGRCSYDFTFNPCIWIDGKIKQITYNGTYPMGEVSGISPNGKYAALQVDGKAALYDIENDKLFIAPTHPSFFTSYGSAVSDNGIIVGFVQNMLDRKAMIWSAGFGMYLLDDYLKELNIELDKKIYNMPEAFGFSADGSKIIATGNYIDQESFFRPLVHEVAIYIEIDEHLRELFPPYDLETVGIDYSNHATFGLKWQKPRETDIYSHYLIYKNDVVIQKIDDLNTTSLDAQYFPGLNEFKIVAVTTDNVESKPATLKTNFTSSSFPFFEEFNDDEKDLLEKGWVSDTPSNAFSLTRYAGIPPGALSHAIPNGSAYTHYVTSPAINLPSNTDNLLLAYNIQIANWGTVTTEVNTLKVQLFNGSDFETIKTYELIPTWETVFFIYEEFEIKTKIEGNKTFIRILAEGDKGVSSSWNIDNIKIFNPESALKITPPTHLNVHFNKDEGVVYLNWADPNEVVNLTYTNDGMEVPIGFEGQDFIAANYYPAEDLASYDDFVMTSISGYFPKDEYFECEPAEYKIYVRSGDEIIYYEDVDFYQVNAWNTFYFEEPLVIDNTKPLYFGFEVLNYVQDYKPMGGGTLEVIWNDDYTEYWVPAGDKATLFSLDFGTTWDYMFIEPYLYTQAWMIKANFAKATKDNGNTIINNPKEQILGYQVWRNGENLLGVDWSGSQLLTPLFSFVDLFPLISTNGSDVEGCYEVSAYYTSQTRSDMSNKVCFGDYDAIDSAEDIKVQFYPNPVKENLIISGDFNYITLYNLNGQAVLKTTQNTIPVSNIPDGIYILEITKENKTVKGKIIIRK
ncbi:T9SS type A sorting domain-containing protein [Bacteroidales bacterium OttesenSCG-928-I14]|nr:T9SS type A sorting domain-containing protein [Bacteroidales bacterium OttesenSCG-928-I14]